MADRCQNGMWLLTLDTSWREICLLKFFCASLGHSLALKTISKEIHIWWCYQKNSFFSFSVALFPWSPINLSLLHSMKALSISWPRRLSERVAPVFWDMISLNLSTACLSLISISSCSHPQRLKFIRDSCQKDQLNKELVTFKAVD